MAISLFIYQKNGMKLQFSEQFTILMLNLEEIPLNLRIKIDYDNNCDNDEYFEIFKDHNKCGRRHRLNENIYQWKLRRRFEHSKHLYDEGIFAFNYYCTRI